MKSMSWLSVTLTSLMITINHWYSLGPAAFLLGAVLVAASSGSLWRFNETGSRLALIGYLAVNTWIVVGFGLFKGLWKTALPLMTDRATGPAVMEISGILTLAGALVVAYTAFQLVAEVRANGPTARRPAPRSAAGHRSAAAALIVASGVFLAASPSAQTRAEEDPIRIGVVATTRGPAGLLGQSFLKSIQLSKEERTATRHRYELDIEEIPSPDQAEPAIRKLIETDKVNALIVAMSMSGEIVKPYAAAAKIPFFCICSVGSLGDELYTFTTMPIAEDEAALWVAEAQRRGVTRIARFTQDFPSIDNHVRAIKEDAAKAGIRFVYEDRFAPTTTDFRAAIAAAREQAPDLYYVEAFNPALDVVGRQLRDAGIENMASVVAFSITDQANLFEGSWYTDSYVSPAFKARLERRYPGTRLATHMMPYAYDSYQLLVDAFESGGNPLSYIRQITEFQGTAGTITKAAGTGNFRSSPAVWQIVGGRPTLLSR